MKPAKDLSLQVAASLDLPESLTPFASQLMRGIDALGSFPTVTVELCKKIGVKRNSSVLDLACGKGSVAIELAAVLGCKVTAVDASPDFIRSAKSLAAARGVKVRCNIADVRAFRPRARFDVVIMLNLFPLEEAAEICRSLVKPGGIILIDDVTLAPGARNPRWLTTGEVREILEEEGDKVLAIRQIPKGLVAKNGKEIEQKVERNGIELAKTHPELRRPLKSYLARLKRSRELLTSALRPTLCVVRSGFTRHTVVQ